MKMSAPRIRRWTSALLSASVMFTSLLIYGVETSITESTPQVTYTPFTLDLGAGKRLEARLGRIEVPECRSKPDGRKITIAFVLLKSTAKDPGPPTVYCEGGPGVPAIQLMQMSAKWRDFLLSLREAGDVVVFDQRGIGRSTPNLTCPDKFQWSEDTLAGDALYAIAVESAKHYAEHMRGQGINLSAYNTAESADDVDAIREALGAPKINLVGFSYGTHLALATLRRHEARVNGIVLMGPAGPDDMMKLPSDIQAQLEKISAFAKKDPAVSKDVPDLLQLMRDVMEDAERRPLLVEVEINGEKKRFQIGRLALEILVFADISDTRDIPNFPRLFHTISKGDYQMLADAIRNRFLKAPLGLVMPPVMRIASGVSKERLERIEKELPGCLLAKALDFPFLSKEYRDAWAVQDLGQDFRAPLKSEVPLLVFTGTLDGNAPVRRGHEICAGFSHGHHMIVENAGHEDFHRPAVSSIVAAFLRTGKAPTEAIQLPSLKFKPL